MSKSWQGKSLHDKCYLDPRGRVYLHAGCIIGHLGCSPFEFFDAAKKLPDYDQYLYENAVRDLTVYAKREASPPRYELTVQAQKVLRVILGPPPDHLEYVKWWHGRLVSVQADRERGLPVEWATEPPVPLPGEKEEEPSVEPKPKRSRKKKSA